MRATGSRLGMCGFRFALTTSLLACGCGESPSTRDRSDAVPVLPIALNTSSDFGLVPSGSGRAMRLVKVYNRSASRIGVSHWVVSCDCLEIRPKAIELEPEESRIIALFFDSDKEGGEFMGQLRISVEAFAGGNPIGSFYVPITVIAEADVAHLDLTREMLGRP